MIEILYELDRIVIECDRNATEMIEILYGIDRNMIKNDRIW